MFKYHNKDLALFEIKLKSPHKDLIFVKGNENECDSIPFEGSIKLSTPEDMHVKRLKLSLIGEYHVEFFERDSNRQIVDQIFERNCVLKVDWNNLLTDAEGRITYGNYGENFTKLSKLLKKQANSRNASVTNLDKINSASNSPNHSHAGSISNLDQLFNPQTGSTNNPPANTSQPPTPPHSSSVVSERPIFARTKSQPSLSKHHANPASKIIKLPKSGIDGTPFKNQLGSSNHSYLLPKGNYNIPFRVYLPTNTCETVEGLNPGKILYKIECSIERGRFEKVFQKAKHIRIVRTLHPQNLNLLESIDINNTWPGKVQYNVSLPKKGIAIGATIPIHILVVPIAKGLKLKSLNAVLVQHYHVAHTEGRSPEFEELFGKQTLAIPDRDKLSLDQWNVKTHFKVPDNLKDLTPTCDLKNNTIQVKHRLRISIQLKNKEGHVSELRANLPVYVYISANIGYTIGKHFEIDPHSSTFVPVSDKEDLLFKKDKKDTTKPTSSGIKSNSQSPNLSATEDLPQVNEGADEDEDIDDNDLDLEDSAPPLYEKHKFDKIYDLSLPQTPLEQFRSQSVANSPLGSAHGSYANISSYFDIPGNHSNLNIDSALSSRNSRTSLATDMGGINVTDYSDPLLKFSKSPLLSPNLDLNTLLKVPSYDQAVDDDDEEGAEDLAPSYDDGSESSRSSSIVSLLKESIPIPKGKSTSNINNLHLSLPKPIKFRHGNLQMPLSPIRAAKSSNSLNSYANTSSTSLSSDVTGGKPSSHHKIHGVPKILQKKK